MYRHKEPRTVWRQEGWGTDIVMVRNPMGQFYGVFGKNEFSSLLHMLIE